jgi:elongation factor Ts
LCRYSPEFCLLSQKFVMDDTVTVGKWVSGEGGLEVVEFVRVKVGEGIEVEEKDFAAEVAATVADAK